MKYGCWISLLLFCCFSVCAVADISSGYRAAEAYITSHHLLNATQQAASHAKAQLPPANSHPNAANYYNNAAVIDRDAASQSSQPNTMGYVTRKDALTRPKITINRKSAAMTFSKTVQSNASGIVDGTYQDCHKKIIIDSSTMLKHCQTSVAQTLDCVGHLSVSVQEKRIIEHLTTPISSSSKVIGYDTIQVPLAAPNGQVNGVNITVNAYGFICHMNFLLIMNGRAIGRYTVTCPPGKLQGTAHITGLSVPFSNGNISLRFMSGVVNIVSGSISYTATVTKKTPIETWTSSCPTLPANCTVTRNQCLTPGATKVIDGIPITEPCWKTKKTVQCGSPMSSACQSLVNAGCTQINSRCASEDQGICTNYDETWSCPSHHQVGTALQCGERFYCLDGRCQPTTATKNKDFGQSITQLNAVASAANDVKQQGSNPNQDPNSIRIFTGHAAHCREVALGALNCCADHGWAKGIFAHCNGEEKALGHAKEQGGLVVYVGRYCSHHFLGFCTEHKRGYCVFPSRIAYDVQVDGRLRQLGRGFGESKTPDCSGLTPNEIGHINFDYIDFSNVINSVVGKANFPNSDQSENSIENAIKKEIEQEQQHG